MSEESEVENTPIVHVGNTNWELAHVEALDAYAVNTNAARSTCRAAIASLGKEPYNLTKRAEWEAELCQLRLDYAAECERIKSETGTALGIAPFWVEAAHAYLMESRCGW